jgi:hypothetical protein
MVILVAMARRVVGAMIIVGAKAKAVVIVAAGIHAKDIG